MGDMFFNDFVRELTYINHVSPSLVVVNLYNITLTDFC